MNNYKKYLTSLTKTMVNVETPIVNSLLTFQTPLTGVFSAKPTTLCSWEKFKKVTFSIQADVLYTDFFWGHRKGRRVWIYTVTYKHLPTGETCCGPCLVPKTGCRHMFGHNPDVLFGVQTSISLSNALFFSFWLTSNSLEVLSFVV